MKIGIDTTFMVECAIREHPGHTAASAELVKRIDAGDVFVAAPQVLSEFIHIVTDAQRFERPLRMAEALEIGKRWWDAAETEHVSPTPESVTQFSNWMTQFNFGRKRVLDTMLAATYYTHEVTRLISSNARDFSVFGCFEVIVPR